MVLRTLVPIALFNDTPTLTERVFVLDFRKTIYRDYFASNDKNIRYFYRITRL